MTGAAGSEELLIAGRMVQGLGASVLTATGLSIVSTTADPADRGRVVGIWAGVGAVGSAGGPLLAGVCDALGSWRIFFLIDVPFALVVLWFAASGPRSGAAPATAAPVDVVGVVALTLGLGGAVLRAARRSGRGLGVGAGASAARPRRSCSSPAFVDARAPRSARRCSIAGLFGEGALPRRRSGGVRRQRRVLGRGVLRVALPPAGAGARPGGRGRSVPRDDRAADRALPPGRSVDRSDRRRPPDGAGLVVVAVSVAMFAGLGVDDGLSSSSVALVLSGVGPGVGVQRLEHRRGRRRRPVPPGSSPG